MRNLKNLLALLCIVWGCCFSSSAFAVSVNYTVVCVESGSTFVDGTYFVANNMIVPQNFTGQGLIDCPGSSPFLNETVIAVVPLVFGSDGSNGPGTVACSPSGAIHCVNGSTGTTACGGTNQPVCSSPCGSVSCLPSVTASDGSIGPGVIACSSSGVIHCLNSVSSGTTGCGGSNQVSCVAPPCGSSACLPAVVASDSTVGVGVVACGGSGQATCAGTVMSGTTACGGTNQPSCSASSGSTSSIPGNPDPATFATMFAFSFCFVTGLYVVSRGIGEVLGMVRNA